MSATNASLAFLSSVAHGAVFRVTVSRCESFSPMVRAGRAVDDWLADMLSSH